MMLTAEEIIDQINEMMNELHCEIMGMSEELNDFEPTMSNDDLKQVIDIYESKRIAHNQYLELQTLLRTICKMEMEKKIICKMEEQKKDTVDTIDTKDTGKKEKKQRVKHNCESCMLYSSFGNCANAESPLYNQFVKEPYNVCKYHKKTLEGNYVHNKIVTKPEEHAYEEKNQ